MLLAVVCLAGMLALPAAAEDKVTAKPQFRALWIPRWELVDPAWTGKMVDDAARAGFTDLFVQVDGRGEAYYRSDILPQAEGLAPGYDPLSLVIEEATRRGLAVHAWVNAFTIGLPGRKPASPFHPLNRHPEWVTYDSKGASLLAWPPEKAKNLVGYYLDPGLPEVQAFVVSIVGELVQRYPLAGVHLDYIRYPGKDYGFHPLSRAIFRASTGLDPLETVPAAPSAAPGADKVVSDRLRVASIRWDQWRRDQISALVRRVSLAVRGARPETRVSAAVFPDLGEAVEDKMQDWPAWLASGDLDFVMMMAYTKDTGLVLRQLERARTAVPGATVYAGLGAYKFGTSHEEFLRQVQEVLLANPAGVALYSYQSMLDMPKVFDALSSGLFSDGKSIQHPDQTVSAK